MNYYKTSIERYGDSYSSPLSGRSYYNLRTPSAGSTQHSSTTKLQSYYKKKPNKNYSEYNTSPVTFRITKESFLKSQRVSPQATRSRSINDSKSIKTEIKQLYSAIITSLEHKKYKQAMSLLYNCERLVYQSNEIPASLKTYTKYLIVTVYYKAGKFDKSIEMAKKIIEGNKEIDIISIQYLMHIRHLLAKSLSVAKNYTAAIKVLVELIEKYNEILKNVNKKVFGEESLLMVKDNLAQCLMVLN